MSKKCLPVVDSDLLRDTLFVTVPLWIERVRGYSEERRLDCARECAQVIAEKGDRILFRGKKWGETATAFNALAEGIGCAAFQPGGLDFLGDHWEVRR